MRHDRVSVCLKVGQIDTGTVDRYCVSQYPRSFLSAGTETHSIGVPVLVLQALNKTLYVLSRVFRDYVR